MVGEKAEERFIADVISSGRITIPSGIQSKLGLEKGTLVRVKFSRGDREEEGIAHIISAGRFTIPRYIQSQLGLEEGDPVQVKIRRYVNKTCMIYKDKKTGLIELVLMVLNYPHLLHTAKKGREFLEGKSIDAEWAYFFQPSWVIEPEAIEDFSPMYQVSDYKQW